MRLICDATYTTYDNCDKLENKTKQRLTLKQQPQDIHFKKKVILKIKL